MTQRAFRLVSLLTASLVALPALAGGLPAAPASLLSVETQPIPGNRYRLSWSGPEPVDIYASRTPDVALDGLLRVAHQLATGVADIAAPYPPGTRTYLAIVGPGAQHPIWTATRLVPLSGASNFRDLGGYATRDGHHVRWGEIYRSNGLSQLTPDDYRVVDALGIRMVCDLRTDQERASQPTRWQGAEPAVYRSPKPGLDQGFATLIASHPDAARMRAVMIEFYRQMPDLYQPEMKAVFARLLAGEVPMITHCTAGKDRTGLASALILSALGVPRDTIEHDYAMSATLLRQAQASADLGHRVPDPTASLMRGMPPAVMQAMMGSDAAYIGAALDSAAQEYGSVDAYLARRLDVGPVQLAALRMRYLD